jgi:hypothetical protein
VSSGAVRDRIISDSGDQRFRCKRVSASGWTAGVAPLAGRARTTRAAPVELLAVATGRMTITSQAASGATSAAVRPTAMRLTTISFLANAANGRSSDWMDGAPPRRVEGPTGVGRMPKRTA